METTTPNTDTTAWKRWCRLCAKEDHGNNLSIFTEIGETIKTMDTTLATAIGKFFWVNIRPNDDISQYVCVDCHTLISSLMQFTERVNKVQAMFCALQNSSNATDFNQIKSQFGLLDEEFEHLIKQERKAKELKSIEDVEADWEIEAENKDTEILELEADGESKAGAEYEIEFVRRVDDDDGDDDDNDDDDDDKAAVRKKSDEATKNEAFAPQVISLSKLVEEAEDEEAEAEEEEEALLQQQQQEEEHIEYEKENEEQLDDAELLQQLMGDEYEVVDNEKGGVAVKAMKQASLHKDNNNIEENKRDESKDEENYEEGEEFILTTEMLENIDETAATDTEHTTTSTTTQQVVEMEVIEKSAQVNKIDSSSKGVPRKKRGRSFKDDAEVGNDNTNKPEHKKQRAIESDDCDDDNAASSSYKYECPICNKKYKNPTSYRKHTMEKHAKEPDIPDFKCEKCDKILPTERQLEIHARTHLALEDKLDVPCPYCERKFTKTAVMRQHVLSIHHNLKPYICDVCGQASKTMAALGEHKLVHTTETPYECEVCNRAFKNKTRLKVHAETHTGTNFICTECGLRLNTRRTLKMHMLVHTDAKRYKCDFCPAAFKRTKALKNHLILHTGMRPYKCPFCEKTFSNGSNCRSHKKKMHAQELAIEEAMGKKPDVVTVPKLEELRQSTTVGIPRKVKRNGGLPLHMREMLIAAEERVKHEDVEIREVEIIDDETEPDGVPSTMEFENEDEVKEDIQLHQRMIEDGEDDDDDNEMVVYEIIAEI